MSIARSKAGWARFFLDPFAAAPRADRQRPQGAGDCRELRTANVILFDCDFVQSLM
jgi:hypothetical protein